VVADDVRTVVAAEPATGTAVPLAGWLARAGAFAIDVLFGLGAIAAVLPVMLSFDRGDWRWWVCVAALAVVILAVALNRLLLPAISGTSIGRALFGLVVVCRDGTPAGPWRLLARDAAHLLDTAAVFLGWVWPLWDRRHRTFADLLARTEVHRTTGNTAHARRNAGIFTAILVLTAVVAAVMSYTAIYRPELATAQAREQIAVQGPKIVEDMLSYSPQTLQADFQRAQGLVTDAYRAQLIEQQNAVAAAKPVPNEYWVTNSAVLSGDTTRASMLLLMQGQRGVVPDQRTITATVKVDFLRAGGGRWQVNALTVLARPSSPGGGG